MNTFAAAKMPMGTDTRQLVGLDESDVTTIEAVMWLTATALVALLAYYFLGYDQGAVSIFGSDTHVHEFVHDARHFLGFPCH